MINRSLGLMFRRSDLDPLRQEKHFRRFLTICFWFLHFCGWPLKEEDLQHDIKPLDPISQIVLWTKQNFVLIQMCQARVLFYCFVSWEQKLLDCWDWFLKDCIVNCSGFCILRDFCLFIDKFSCKNYPE